MGNITRIFIALACFVLSFAAKAQNGTWSGKLEVQGMNLTVVFHIDENGCTFDSPDQGAKGIPAEASLSDLGKVVIKIPSIHGSFEGIWTGNKIVGTFSQLGASFPLTLSPGAIRRNRPQTPQEPFPYKTEEVSFTNGDAILKGTLTLPEGADKTTPVLILVTGSGLQNRDEEIFEHKPFAVIADAFARGGVATLRYDDRGFGESTGDLANCTTEDLKNDALAGIGLLRERFDRVGVLGHSEGGTIAVMLAAEDKADFIVSLAGMTVSGKDLLLWQNSLALQSANLPVETRETYCDLLNKAYEAVTEGEALPSADDYNLPDALKQNYAAAAMQLQTPYMKYFLNMDAGPLLNKVNCPVLALNGTKDTQVECETNLSCFRNNLPAGKTNRVEALTGLNHLFQHCTSGTFNEYKDIEETFAPEVLSIILDWIKGL